MDLWHGYPGPQLKTVAIWLFTKRQEASPGHQPKIGELMTVTAGKPSPLPEKNYFTHKHVIPAVRNTDKSKKFLDSND